MDPFLDLVELLRPRATLWARIDAAGPWGVSFRQREDTLFCWVERGQCQLLRPDAAPVSLGQDDFALVRTSTPFTLTTDRDVTPLDSEALVAASGSTVMELGGGTEAPVILHGGRFVFDTANEHMLMSLLPQVVHVVANGATSEPLQTLLAMNRNESKARRPGSQFAVTRLMELIFLEILRSDAFHLDQLQTGLLAGLADPVVGLALKAMHCTIAQGWTVASLAHLCGISRSGFSDRFSRLMGVAPMEYLQQWRLAVAKDELRRDTYTIAEIALRIGFQSASAFSTAFTRALGTSPRSYRETRRRPAKPERAQRREDLTVPPFLP